MRTIIPTLLAPALAVLLAPSARAESLDDIYAKAKSEGALSIYGGGPARLYEGWVKEHEARFKQAGLDASLRRVFGIMQQAGALPGETAYEPARFVDESYLAESRR